MSSTPDSLPRGGSGWKETTARRNRNANPPPASSSCSTFMIASSGIALGMTWWQCWLAVWIGYSLSGLFLAANAYAGAEYHIIFPAYIRASFGPILGIWCTLNRGVMACVWYGTQAWLGGQAFYTLILSIWPSFRHLHNGIPSSGTDTAHFICFFLFSLVSLGAIWFPIHQIRHLFQGVRRSGRGDRALCYLHRQGARCRRPYPRQGDRRWEHARMGVRWVRNRQYSQYGHLDHQRKWTRLGGTVSSLLTIFLPRSRSTLPRAPRNLPTSSCPKSSRCPCALPSLRSSAS